MHFVLELVSNPVDRACVTKDTRRNALHEGQEISLALALQYSARVQ
jgi:hypothetical protein